MVMKDLRSESEFDEVGKGVRVVAYRRVELNRVCVRYDECATVVSSELR